MSSTVRYLAIGALFTALCLVTVERGTSKIEAEAQRQAAAVVAGLEHVVVLADGRRLAIQGLLRVDHPFELTPAVGDLIDSINALPAVGSVAAQVELRERQTRTANQTMLIRS